MPNSNLVFATHSDEPWPTSMNRHRASHQFPVTALRFDPPVAPGGYVWWYLDGLSDDGNHGITLIALIGSVFSPYYAWARRRGPVDPLNFCALNVALYGRSGKRWALTERRRAAVQRTASTLMLGPSRLFWDGNALTVDIQERGAPIPLPIHGQVRLYPSALPGQAFNLDRHAQHHWWPIAPLARLEVALQQPGLHWQGNGYLDSNWGSVPMEQSFRRWDWSRAQTHHNSVVLYAPHERTPGPEARLALRFNAQGAIEHFPPPPAVGLPMTRLWRIHRETQADAGQPAQVLKTLEDTPFYARSLIKTQVQGAAAIALHESLNLERFRTPWVQMLLPFRMPRAWR